MHRIQINNKDFRTKNRNLIIRLKSKKIMPKNNTKDKDNFINRCPINISNLAIKTVQTTTNIKGRNKMGCPIQLFLKNS